LLWTTPRPEKLPAARALPARGNHLSRPLTRAGAGAGTRRRQQRLAEVAELIHVASLLHDDVLDNAATRCARCPRRALALRRAGAACAR